MYQVPEWVPNVHPLVVHFPIALLVVAALADVLGLVLRRRGPGLRYVAVGLYALGAATAVAAFFTGRSAADGLDIPASAFAAVGEHADWALWTAWAYGLYALARVAVVGWSRYRGGRLHAGLHAALVALGVAGIVLVAETAEHGARLVYDLGLGVRAVGAAEADPFAPADEHAGTTARETAATGGADAPALQTTGEGAWRWEAEAAALPTGFEFLEGSRAELDIAASSAPGGGLALRTSERLLLVAGQPLEGAEVRARLDLSGFTGRVALVHHAQRADAYDFLAVDKSAEGASVVQGRVAEGQVQVFDEATLAGDATDGVFALRAIAYGTHFRGYLGGDMIVHGHGNAAPDGRAGLLVEGSGSLRLLRLEATPVEG
jgi:uncharacterized membrane protein